MVSSRLSHNLTVLHCAANAAVVGLPPVLLLDADGAHWQVREHDHAMRMHLTTACGAHHRGSMLRDRLEAHGALPPAWAHNPWDCARVSHYHVPVI